jgi:hypothetical protein
MMRNFLRGVMLLACCLLAGSGLSCDKIKAELGGKWGTQTTIDGLLGYKLGDFESSIDSSQFPVHSPGTYRTDMLPIVIGGETFNGNVELKLQSDKISEIRFDAPNISSDELKKMQAAAIKEIRGKYSKDLLKYTSTSNDYKLSDAQSHTLALTTVEATIADNDAEFHYAVADHDIGS